MNIHLKPHAAHTQRIVHIALVVDPKLLRQNIDDLMVVGDRYRARRFHHPVNILLGDFIFFLDRHHTARVQAADVRPGNTGINVVDMAIGHDFRFFDDTVNRRNGRLNIDHRAPFQAARWLHAVTDHL